MSAGLTLFPALRPAASASPAAPAAVPAPREAAPRQIKESPGVLAHRLESDDRYDSSELRNFWGAPLCWMPADRLPEHFASELLAFLQAQRK